MSKQHFEDAARRVRAIDDRDRALTVADAFADLFETWAARFNRARFMQACGF